MQTIAFGMDKQWDPAVWHRELYLVTCDGTWWRIIWEKEFVCVCVCIFLYIWLGQFAVQQKLTEHYKSTVIEKIKILKKTKERH